MTIQTNNIVEKSNYVKPVKNKKQVSELKFQRDFSSNPNKEVKFMNRPKFTNMRNDSENNYEPIMPDNTTSNINNMFKPLINPNMIE